MSNYIGNPIDYSVATSALEAAIDEEIRRMSGDPIQQADGRWLDKQLGPVPDRKISIGRPS